jgi:hypothetical protein
MLTSIDPCELVQQQEEFADETRMIGEDGYVLATVQTAIEYLLTFDPPTPTTPTTSTMSSTDDTVVIARCSSTEAQIEVVAVQSEPPVHTRVVDVVDDDDGVLDDNAL